MTDKEREKFMKFMDDRLKKFIKDPSLARKFLVDAGIYTPKGNLRKPYRNLCIPQDPA
jgi:hypothetical protein